MTNKLFAVLDYHADVPPDWDVFHEGESEQDSLPVYSGNVNVIASEKQNLLVIYT